MKNLLIFFLLGFAVIGCQTHQQLVIKEPLHVFSIAKSQAIERMPLPNKRITPSVSIAAVGDIMIGNHTTYYIQKYGVDYPFDSTREVLSQAHIAFGNLESPFTRTGTKFEKRFNFKVPPEFAPGLIRAGFDVVTLANNHILDYGIQGLKNTLSVLDSIGLAYCGAGLNRDQAQQPAIIERNGFRIGFLGYSMTFPEEFWAGRSRGGTNYPFNLKKNIEQTDSLADFVVVTFHWGGEGMNYPKEYQKHFAHLAIDCGADLVLGHHPHVLQGLEIYNNRLIVYSLGNFSFSSYSRKAYESMILKSYLTYNGLLYARIIPISVDNYEISFQPKILRGSRAEAIIANLQKYSEPLNSTNIIDDDGYIWGIHFARDDSLLTQKMNKVSSNGAN